MNAIWRVLGVIGCYFTWHLHTFCVVIGGFRPRAQNAGVRTGANSIGNAPMLGFRARAYGLEQGLRIRD